MRVGRTRVHPPIDRRYAPLQRPTRLRCQTADSLKHETNRATSLPFLRFSPYAKVGPFPDVVGAASGASFAELAVDWVVGMPLEELAAHIMKRGLGHVDDPQAASMKPRQGARRADRLSPTMADGVPWTLSPTVANIAFLEQQIKRVRRAIEHGVKAFPAIPATMRGIGHVAAAVVLAESGDSHRLRTDGALHTCIGLAWREHQWGSFEADEPPLSRSGNPYPRHCATQPANAVRVPEPGYAAV